VRPPSGFEGHLSRRQAAAELGLPSEYRIRQFEREGRLHPVRGAMGSAWYPRAEVMALRPLLSAPAALRRRRWSDGELIALLRQGRSLVDLVVDTGVGMTRARQVHRFWSAHEVRAAAERRSPGRLERDALIQQLRDPSAELRAEAFERLKSLR
jgi:hypothetical protein